MHHLSYINLQEILRLIAVMIELLPSYRHFIISTYKRCIFDSIIFSADNLLFQIVNGIPIPLTSFKII